MKRSLLAIVFFTVSMLTANKVFSQVDFSKVLKGYPGATIMPDGFEIPPVGTVVDSSYDMPDVDFDSIVHWIKLRMIAVKIPYCYRQSYTRDVGVVRSACANGLEKDPAGQLCYPKCNAGENGIGPLCWKPCPSTYTDNGVTCGRGADSKSAPSVLGTCPPGYTNVGLTCFRPVDSYSAPSTVANCPEGYKNMGVSCYKAPDTYSAPSTLADCPAGYTNMGASCFRGVDSYTKGCTTIFKKYPCKDGYTDMGCFCSRGADSKSMSSMTCPPDRFKNGGRCYVNCKEGYTNNGETCGRGADSKSTDVMTCASDRFRKGGLCYVTCRDGYTNIGEFCSKAADTKSMSSMTCPSGYFQGADARCHQNCPDGYTNTGETCYKGPSTVKHENYGRGVGQVLQCPPGTQPDETGGPLGLCYKQACKAGFHGVGPVCWQDCVNGMVPCGAGCALNNVECGTTTFDQVFSVAILAANIATFGEATPVTEGLKEGEEAIEVGTKQIKVTTKLGKAAARVVAEIKGVDKFAAGTEGLVWYKKILIPAFYISKAENAVNTPFKIIKMGKTVSKKTWDAVKYFQNVSSDEFAQQTSPEINAEIDKHFNPTMAVAIKKAWGNIALSQMMATDALAWGSTAFSLLSIADPTGVMGVISAYGKPPCQDLIPFPKLTKNYKEYK